MIKKLDLHRIRHEYVRNETIRFIESNWGSGKEVEIITGNSIEMRILVMNILDEYGLTYQIRSLNRWRCIFFNYLRG